jgi:hypothetical protein
MKPANWDKMAIDDRIDFGNGLLRSYRGSYLLAQALHVAVETMSKRPMKEREVSNIQDMEVLLETCFSAFLPIFNLNYKAVTAAVGSSKKRR